MIIRTPNRDRYTIICQETLEDSRLSWQARGMLAYLLSKPDGWKVSVQNLVNQGPLGRDGVYTVLAELEDAGYLRRVQGRAASGRFGGTDVEIHETPATSENAASPQVAPVTASPDTVQPDTAKTTRVSTNSLAITEESNLDPLSECAQSLAVLAFEQTPRPVTKFVAVRGNIQRILEAGHPPARVAAAICEGHMNVWTLAAMELALTKVEMKDIEPEYTAPTGDLAQRAQWWDVYWRTGDDEYADWEATPRLPDGSWVTLKGKPYWVVDGKQVWEPPRGPQDRP